MTVAERIEALLKDKKMTQKEAAAAIGVTPQAVNRWVKGVAAPNAEATMRLAELLKVTPGYLAYGDEQPPVPDDEAGMIVLRRFDFAAACGTEISEQEVAGVERITVSREWFARQIKHPREDTSSYSLVNVRGSSMSPTWSDGDVLLVDNAQDTIDRDGFYIFSFDGTEYAKRVQRIGRTLLIISDNKNYQAFKIEGSDLELVKVHGRIIKALNIQDLE